MCILATDSSVCGPLCRGDKKTKSVENNRYGKFILKSHNVIGGVYTP